MEEREHRLQRVQMVQREETEKTDGKQVMVESRKLGFLTCPHCWTDQRTERNFCYFCGAGFIYRDEQEKCVNE